MALTPVCPRRKGIGDAAARRVLSVADTDELVNVEELSLEAGRQYLDREARRLVEMSGDEFRAKWPAGADAGGEEDTTSLYLAALLPLAE